MQKVTKQKEKILRLTLFYSKDFNMKFILILIFTSSVIFAQDGIVKTYYPNGNLQSEINYAADVREGLAKFYYENGKIKEERTYVNGRVEGLVKIYNPNDKLRETFVIEDGKRNGPVSVYDSNGVYISDLNYVDGKLVVEDKYKSYVFNSSKTINTNNTSKESASEDKQNNIKEQSVSTFLPPEVEEKITEDDPAYYLSVEVMPEPVGGMKWIYKKLTYPEKAKSENIEGTVLLNAFINRNGDVEKVEVVKSLGYGCDEAAKIAVLYTKFKPGLLRGKPVNVQMSIPIEFKLNDNR